MAKHEINVQDGFLFQCLKEGTALTFALITGSSVDGRIKRFDRYTIVVESPHGRLVLLFKSALAQIAASQDNGRRDLHRTTDGIAPHGSTTYVTKAMEAGSEGKFSTGDRRGSYFPLTFLNSGSYKRGWSFTVARGWSFTVKRGWSFTVFEGVVFHRASPGSAPLGGGLSPS